MMKLDVVLTELRSVFAKYNAIEQAVLFGSRARGDFGERSDYDVAIYGSIAAVDKLTLRAFCAEELHTLHKVDLIFMDEQTDPVFLESIKREGEVFYGKI